MRNRILAKLRDAGTGRSNPWVIAITVTIGDNSWRVLDTSIAKRRTSAHFREFVSGARMNRRGLLTSITWFSNAIVLPFVGVWMSSLIGPQSDSTCRGVAIFTVSSFLCGTCAEASVVLVFLSDFCRALEAEELQPSEQAIFEMTRFSLERRRGPWRFAVVRACGGGGTYDRTLAGWAGITDNFFVALDFFYINVPVGIISLLLTSVLVSDPTVYEKGECQKGGFRIDYIGHWFDQPGAWQHADHSG